MFSTPERWSQDLREAQNLILKWFKRKLKRAKQEWNKITELKFHDRSSPDFQPIFDRFSIDSGPIFDQFSTEIRPVIYHFSHCLTRSSFSILKKNFTSKSLFNTRNRYHSTQESWHSRFQTILKDSTKPGSTFGNNCCIIVIISNRKRYLSLQKNWHFRFQTISKCPNFEKVSTCSTNRNFQVLKHISNSKSFSDQKRISFDAESMLLRCQTIFEFPKWWLIFIIFDKSKFSIFKKQYLNHRDCFRLVTDILRNREVCI